MKTIDIADAPVGAFIVDGEDAKVLQKWDETAMPWSVAKTCWWFTDEQVQSIFLSLKGFRCVVEEPERKVWRGSFGEDWDTASLDLPKGMYKYVIYPAGTPEPLPDHALDLLEKVSEGAISTWAKLADAAQAILKENGR